MTILLCAATPWESRPLASALGLRPDGAGRWSGRLGENEVVLLETGMGGRNAETATAGISLDSETLVISTGFAGALQPGLKTGDIVADLRGGLASTVFNARTCAQAQNRPFHPGAFVSVDSVLADPEQKKTLGEARRAVAVDMETDALRSWAAEKGAGFAAVRVVLDELQDTLPSDAPESQDFSALLRYAAMHWRRLPLLIRTGLKQGRAIEALCAYLKELTPVLGREVCDEEPA